ncbi:MAG TPA: glycosyltransferase family 4 protein [Gemmatimonadaceae bacterium]|nr:glycosyltransferase family 4 protein [Gemmatimonadaceae bacterium]
MIRPRLLLVGNFLSATRSNLTVGEELATRLRDAGWTVLTTSSRQRRLPRVYDMVASVWRQRANYDVAQVDVYSGNAFVWAEAVCAALQLARRPYVLTLHGGNLPHFSKRWPKRVQHVLRGAAAVTTPSRYLLEHLRQFREDMQLLPNAIELDRYAFRARSKPAPRLVWLRAFHRLYDPSLAVEVAARLSREMADVQLTMVGSDTGDGAFADTKRAIVRLTLDGQIFLPGGVPKRDVPTWLGAADIFLNTTTVDNTPVSVIEAMACGLCVVSTAVGGIPYLLEDGETALLVPARDAAAMTNAVLRVLLDPPLAERLSRKARSKAESMDWGVVLPRWEALFSDVARSSTK